MGRAAKAPSRRDADSRFRLGVLAGRRALIRRLSTFVLIAVVCPGVQPQAAERLDEDLRERLLQLKQLCDEGLVDTEVCKEKQRQILGLPAPASGTQPIEPATSRQAPEPGRGFLGIVVDSLVEEGDAAQGDAARLGLVVTRVLEGGPAEQADLQVGDVILELAGQAVGSAEELTALEAGLVPSAKATLKVSRQPGTEITLEATAIDRRQYPPARLHTSPLGFNVRLPAGWTVSQGPQLEGGLEALARHLGENPNALAIVDYARKLSQNVDLEIYSKGKNFISVVKKTVPLPRTAHDGQELCAAISANRSKATGRRIEVHDCSFKTISGSPAFCVDLDAMVVGKRTRQCWITNRDKGMVVVTFTFEDKVQELKIAEFEEVMASITWQ